MISEVLRFLGFIVLGLVIAVGVIIAGMIGYRIYEAEEEREKDG